MSFRGQKTFVSHSEIVILADDLPYSKRLPRLRESLAEPTRGAAQPQRSEVVFNSMRDLLPSSDSLDYANRWRSPHTEPPSHSDRKSCSTRREISSSVNCRIRRFPVRRPNSFPGARSQAADVIAYGHCFAQTGITFRSIIGIAYKTPIRNRHSEALDAPLRHFDGSDRLSVCMEASVWPMT
ncbi:hypothetical protein Taro_008243 [Colocasia esculenta]|uniref:Uncharacterized protein n=1 Tax=Colocasia esculenta TaxID=4460 RepID=A0A843TXP6_COLES|nr:hypothetical protein [Colocasia esculenta]